MIILYEWRYEVKNQIKKIVLKKLNHIGVFYEKEKYRCIFLSVASWYADLCDSSSNSGSRGSHSYSCD